MKNWCQIKLISMEYLQCSVFMGACAIINSELVIPCDVNGACEFWSSTHTGSQLHRCWCQFWVGNIYQYSAFGTCAELLSQPGLLVCGLKSLWLAPVRVMSLLPLEVQTFTEGTTCSVIALTSPMKVWYHLTCLTWTFEDSGLLRTETLNTLI